MAYSRSASACMNPVVLGQPYYLTVVAAGGVYVCVCVCAHVCVCVYESCGISQRHYLTVVAAGGVSVCMCVCMHVCMYGPCGIRPDLLFDHCCCMYMCVRTYLCMNLVSLDHLYYLEVFASEGMYVCMYVCMSTVVLAQPYRLTIIATRYVCMYVCMCIYMCVFVCTGIFMHVCICIACEHMHACYV